MSTFREKVKALLDSQCLARRDHCPVADNPFNEEGCKVCHRNDSQAAEIDQLREEK